MSERVAVLVAEHTKLREVRIGDLEALDLCVGYDAVDGYVRSILVLVEDYCVTMRESTSFYILSTDSYMEALVDQT